MAKKISVTDIFEEADIFLKIRKSAEDTIITLGKMKAELSESAKLVKEGVKNSSVTNTKGIQEFTNFTQKANQLQRESIEIQKQEAQAKKLVVQATMEEVKLKKLADAEAQKQINASAKIAKALQNEASVYKQLEKNTRDYKNQSKELAATLLQMRDNGQKSTDQYAKLEQQFREVTAEAQKGDVELKRIDKTVGDNFRNVGNYEGAIKPLKLQLRELTQAMQNMSTTDPRFQEMANKAGELKDQIQDTASVIKSTAGSGLENMAGSMAKVGQVGVAAFQGVQSSMVLLGVENEGVLKSMQKLQALAGLGDALKVLGGVGDTVTEIKAGFTAAIAKMSAFVLGTNAGTAAQVTQLGVTEAQTAATVANTAVNEAGLAVDTAKAVLDTEQAVVGAENLVATVAQTGATAANTSATIAGAVATGTATAATALQGTATTATAVATTGLSTSMKLLRVALIASGIGMIIVILGLAAEAMGVFSDKTEEEEQAQKDLEKQTKKLEKTIEKYSKTTADAIQVIDNITRSELALARQRGASQEELTKITRLGVKARIIEYEAEKERLRKLYLEASRTGSNENFLKAEKAYQDAIQVTTDAKISLQELDADIAEQKRDNANEHRNNTKTEVVTNTELIAKIKELQKARQDLNVSDEQVLANQLLRDQQELQNIYNKSKKDQQAKDELLKGKKLLEQKYWDDIKKIEDDADKTQQERIDARKKQEADRLNNIADLEEKARDEYDKATMSARQLEERNINDKYFYLIAQAEKYGWDIEALKKKQAEEIAALDKKEAKTSVKTEKQRQEEIKKMVQQTSEFFTKQSEKKVAILDKEILASEKQLDSLKALADSGNINAKDSMAEQQRIIDEGNRQKLAEQKRQARIKLAESVYSTYSQKVEDGSKNPLADTIKDTVLLQQFISSLPAFEKGTEDTGKNGLGVDGKGGFHAVLHPNERVIPKGLNEQIGNLTNEQLAKVAQEYQNGKSINGGLQVQSSMDFALLMNEVKDLKSVIKNKPETNIEIGEITGSLMEIVQSTKRGNNTTYNRFKVRK